MVNPVPAIAERKVLSLAKLTSKTQRTLRRLTETLPTFYAILNAKQEWYMELSRALADDILSVLPLGGPYRPARDITKLVAPLREDEVRATIRDLVKRGHLDVNRGGGGWPAYYGRRPFPRRF